MQKFVVAFYAIDRAWGGPEEGGWWYDCGEFVRLHALFRGEDRAAKAAMRANRLLDIIQRGQRRIDSVLYAGGRFRACVFEGQAPPRFPLTRPRYD